MIKQSKSIVMTLFVVFFLMCQLSFAGEIDNWDDPLEFPLLDSVNGYFNEDTQVNYFILSASSDGQYTISYDAGGNSLYVQLFAAEPEEGGGTNIISYDYDTHVSYYALKAGMYKIRVTDPYDATTSYTLTNSFAPPTFAADIEPNNTAVAALPLLMDGEVYGHMGYAYDAYGGMPVYNRSDILDVWKIETEEDGYLFIDSALAETLDMNLYLYDADDQLMVAYYESDSLTTVEHQLTAGTYYVKTDFDSGFGSYMLTTSLEEAFLENDPEPNDEILTATVLPVGEEDTGHIGFATDAKDSITGYYKVYDTEDYWQITTPVDGILTVATTANEDFDEGPIVHLYMYSEDGKLMKSNYNSTSSLTMESSIEVSAGTYYAKVDHASGYGSYLIACELDSTMLAVDTESNNTREDAVEITLEEPVTGHLGFITETRSGMNGDYNVFDTDDYWKVSYDEDTELEITLTIEADFEDTLSTYLYVYNEENTLIHSDYNSKQIVKTSIPFAREAGYLYVRVYRVDGYGSYTLSAELSSTALPEDANQDNPNDLIADATQLPINNQATGHLGFTKKNTTDTIDHWTFYAEKEDTIYVTAFSEDEFEMGPAMYLQLYKDGALRISDYNYDNEDKTQIAYCVTPGTYVAAVRLKSGGGYGSYTFSVSYLSEDISIITETLDNATSGEDYSMPIDVRYGGEEIVMFELLDSPQWLSISEDGVLSGNPGNETLDSEIPISIRAYISSSEDTLLTSLIVSSSTIVAEENHPAAFSVSNAFPNPFNPSTTIRYEVPVECDVRLEIFDIFGRKIAVLADSRMSPGAYDAVWDSRNNLRGITIGSGVYIYRFTAQDYIHSGKVMLLQ